MKAYPVTILCAVMQVSRSGFYDYLHSGTDPDDPLSDRELKARIRGIFKLSRSSYGSRRMVRQLRSEGCQIGRYKVRRLMRQLGLKVNFDTNGYLTHASLIKVLKYATSITYDIKAFNDEVHLALTGASSKPVLRNAEYIGRFAKEKLWEFRILVIPEINETKIKPLCSFIADIDVDLPVCFLAFRPNYVLEHHPGAPAELMEYCVAIAQQSGLKNVKWSLKKFSINGGYSKLLN